MLTSVKDALLGVLGVFTLCAIAYVLLNVFLLVFGNLPNGLADWIYSIVSY